MNDISVINYQLNDNFKDKIDCPICYKLSNDFFKANCNHSWCNDCNKKIKSNLCPICRYEFKDKEVDIDSILEYLRIRIEIRESRRQRRIRRRRETIDYIIKIFKKYLCIN